MNPNDGDNYLSGHDRYLWSLCYSTLERFGCLTMFKKQGPDVRFKANEDITFFVPWQHPKAEEVKAYLENELRHEARAPSETDGEWMWGTTVKVLMFSGLVGYVDHDRMAELTEPMIENFIASLRNRTVTKN